MHEDFWGLNASPFELSPDPFFLFPSEKSRHALASIVWAINRRKGFVVMTGEVGTGKTMMLRCLFELWEREQIPFAYFIGPRLSTIDFLSYITLELGITVAEPTKGNLLRALYGFLLTQFERGLTTVLIIDEAHQIPRRVLEEIRLLTNFETAQQKLVQILLAGQPELDTNLDSPELRSLKQRIAVRCRLEPLSEEEVCNYIRHRLEIAGAAPAQASAIFPAETINAVFRYSLGIPRLVNSVCDQAMMAAGARQIRVVSVEMIDEIAFQFRLNPATHSKPSEKSLSHARLPEAVASGQWSRPIAPKFNLQATKVSQPVAGLPVEEMRAAAQDSILREEGVSVAIQTENEASSHKLNQTRGTMAVKAISLPEEPSVLLSASASVAANRMAVATSGPRPAITPQKPALAEPAMDRAAATAPIPQAGFRFNRIDLNSFRMPRLIRNWLRPELRLPIIVGTAVVAAGLGLTTGISKARRPRAAVAVRQPLASPSNNAAELKPVRTTRRVEESSDSFAIDPVPRIESRIPPSSEFVDHVKPRTKITMSHPSRPKSPRLVTSSDPPTILAAPINDLNIGEGLPDILIPPSGSTPHPIKTGGRLQQPKLLLSVPPVYPPAARLVKKQGAVIIDAIVDEAGKVGELKVVSGSALLAQAAMDAVKTWKYEPARLNGDPIAVHIQVRVNFSLP